MIEFCFTHPIFDLSSSLKRNGAGNRTTTGRFLPECGVMKP